MEQLKKIKQTIIDTAPSYEKMSDTKSDTGNILQARSSLGFTRIFYPGLHIEADKKLFNRRFKVKMFSNRYFGPRGEIFYFILFFTGYYIYCRNNIKKERLNRHLVDKNVYYYIDSGKTPEVNKIEE